MSLLQLCCNTFCISCYKLYQLLLQHCSDDVNGMRLGAGPMATDLQQRVRAAPQHLTLARFFLHSPIDISPRERTLPTALFELFPCDETLLT